MIARSLGGQFCDDIRHEVGGKTSYIGCYRDILEVEAFPVTLAKLCAHVRLVTPSQDPFKSVRFVVLKDDEEIAGGDLPSEDLAAHADRSTPEDGTIQSVYVQFVMSPVQLEGPCVFRVRAHTENGELRGLGLKVQERG